MDGDLQHAIDLTITAHLNGAGLHGIPDYRTVEIQIAGDMASGRLVCPDHSTLIADLDHNLMITAEYGCPECDYLACTNCDQRLQRPCTEHRSDEAVTA